MQSFDEINLTKEDYQNGWLEAYENQRDEILWKEEPIEFLPKYAEIFKDNNINKILDAGCGDGRNSMFLLREKFTVVGIDLSNIAVHKALIWSKKLHFNTGLFLQTDLESLPNPFPPEMFDALVCLDVFGQLLEVDKTVIGFKSVVKRGGLLVINLYTPDDVAFGEGERLGEKTFLYKQTLYRFFTQEDAQSLFDKKFEIVDIKKLQWEDPPHPGYRDYPHKHDSIVVCLKNL